MATTLLRVARDPVNGRIKRPTTVDVGLRAALLADLALAGRIGDRDHAPCVISAEPTGDRFLDAVSRAIEARPGVVWMRWFRHVTSDRTALRDELVRDGRWQRRPGWRRAYEDTNAEAIVALSVELDRVAQLQRPPADEREATLAVLAAISGATGRWPRPGAVKHDLAAVVHAVPDFTVRRIIMTAAMTLRRTRRSLGLR